MCKKGGNLGIAVEKVEQSSEDHNLAGHLAVRAAMLTCDDEYLPVEISKMLRLWLHGRRRLSLLIPATAIRS